MYSGAMLARILLVLSFCLAIVAAPAAAALAADSAASSAAVKVPEGSQATLFALGILGVIIGRRLSMRGKGGKGGKANKRPDDRV